MLKCDIDQRGLRGWTNSETESSASTNRLVSREGLLEVGGALCGLEGLTGLLPLLHRAKPGFDPLGELLATLTRHTLHRLLNAAVGPDAETYRALSHPGRGKGALMLAVFSPGDEDP